MSWGEFFEWVSQTLIFFLGPLSLYMVTNKNKWGNVVGLSLQPFWIYTSIYNRQPGVFCVTIICTGIWLNGVRQWFFVPVPEKSCGQAVPTQAAQA